MFSYYGSKGRFIDYYPKPIYDTIIEPFAGSAKYSCAYPEKKVILIDKFQHVVNAWQAILSASKEDIEALVQPAPYENFLKYCKDENQKSLYAFITTFAANSTRCSSSKYVERVFRACKARMLANVELIKHWECSKGNYTDAPDIEATWFLDGPYQFGGEHYNCSNKKINFNHLREWALSRKGQIIICENTRAQWIEITPFAKNWGLAGKRSVEGYWTNMGYVTKNNQTVLDLMAA